MPTTTTTSNTIATTNPNVEEGDCKSAANTESGKKNAASTESGKIRIVVLGMGYAGSMLTKALEKELSKPKYQDTEVEITCINPFPMVWLKIGSIRGAIRGGKWAERTSIPIEDVIDKAKFVCGKASGVDDKKKTLTVELSDDSGTQQVVPWDVLIVATGATNVSVGNLPENVRTVEDAQKHMNEQAKAIEEASDITVIGGGASGIEIAGEIRKKYADKKLRIVTAADDALTSSVAPPSRKFLKRLYKRLEANDIELIRGERVVSPAKDEFGEEHYLRGQRKVKCKGYKNAEFTSDLVLLATSWKVSSDIFPAEWINYVGELDINDHFQLEARADVFAFGDVSSLSETKQVITMPEKVPYAVHNIMEVVKAIHETKDASDVNPKRLRKWKVSDKAVMYLPIGPDDGVSLTKNGWTWGKRQTSKWKGRDLFTNKFYKMLAEKPAPEASLN